MSAVLKNSRIESVVAPSGMPPTYTLRACRVAGELLELMLPAVMGKIGIPDGMVLPGLRWCGMGPGGGGIGNGGGRALFIPGIPV